MAAMFNRLLLLHTKSATFARKELRYFERRSLHPWPKRAAGFGQLRQVTS
jgi:hypothetical protein